MSTEQVALALAEEYGLPVFPCRPDKRPYTTHGLKDATGSIEQIATWWQSWPDALIGVPTGTASKLLVVDIDPAGEDWYREHFARLAPGRIHKTQRGHHLLYTMPDAPIRNSAGKIAPGVDVRAEGGYIIWWPAEGHETTGDLADIGPAPDWLIKQLTTAPERTAPTSNGNGRITEGGRNDAMTRLAGKMRRIGATQDEIENALIALNERCDPPLGAAELERIAGSISRYAAASGEERPYMLTAVGDLLTAGTPPEYRVHGFFEDGADVGVIGAPESGKSLLMQNVAACVATGRDFHGRKTRRGLVVYLAGEGQHGLRARFQALEERYHLGLATAPLVIARTATSFLDVTEVLRIHSAIAAAEDHHEMPLALLIVDTVARFLAPGDESKAQDMGAYLNAVKQLRGDATAVSLHHPGHGDGTRARGSSSWRAALDAEFSLVNAAGIITVTCHKMKDGPKPDPFSYRIETAGTRMAREDGSPVQSVVLVPTDLQAVRPALTGKNQRRLLAALEEQPASWTEEELRRVGRNLGMHKSSAREAVLGLRQLGYLTAELGGSRLTTLPDQGTKGRKWDGSPKTSPVQGTETRDGNDVSFRNVLPSRPVPDPHLPETIP